MHISTNKKRNKGVSFFIVAETRQYVITHNSVLRVYMYQVCVQRENFGRCTFCILRNLMTFQLLCRVEDSWKTPWLK